MKILLVSATTLEIAPTIHFLENQWTQVSFSKFTKNKCQVLPLVSGIGSMMMAFSLARHKHIQEMELIIHAGISGSYRSELKPTELVEVISEQWADLGAEDANGNFIDSFELGLMQKERFPYKSDKLLKTKQTIPTGLKQVAGLTVNKSSGSITTISKMKEKFHADVESMEGAGLFYACNVMDIPFVSIRAISNYVEPRDKSKWKIEESIAKLNKTVIKLLEDLEAPI